MKTRICISIDEELTIKSQDYARQKGTSLSLLVNNWLYSLIGSRKKMTKKELFFESMKKMRKMIRLNQMVADTLKEKRKFYNTLKFRAVNIWKQTKPRIFQMRGTEKLTAFEINIIVEELKLVLFVIPHSSFKTYCEKVYKQFIKILKHKEIKNHEKVELLDYMFKRLGHMEIIDENLQNEKGFNYGKG